MPKIVLRTILLAGKGMNQRPKEEPLLLSHQLRQL